MMRALLLTGVLGLACEGTCQADALEFPDFSKHAQVWRGAETRIKDSRQCVISTSKAWRALWKEHQPDAMVPELDFEHAMVLAVFNPKWTDKAFRIHRVVRGTLTSDSFSHNVFLKTDDKAPRNRFEMVRVDRTRLDFRFYAQGKKATVSRAAVVARVDTSIGHKPAESLIAAADKLMAEFPRARSERQKQIIARLASFGEPLRPHLNRILHGETRPDPSELIAGTSPRFSLARQVVAQMLRDEVSVRGKAIRHCEVALARALVEIEKRIKVKGEPWYLVPQVRCVAKVWYVNVHGTFGFSSDRETCHQKGVNGRIALRASDGKLLHCKIGRGDRNVGELIQQNAPGVVPVEPTKRKL